MLVNQCKVFNRSKAMIIEQKPFSSIYVRKCVLSFIYSHLFIYWVSAKGKGRKLSRTNEDERVSPIYSSFFLYWAYSSWNGSKNLINIFSHGKRYIYIYKFRCMCAYMRIYIYMCIFCVFCLLMKFRYFSKVLCLLKQWRIVLCEVLSRIE